MTVRIGVQTKQMALGVSSYTMNDPTTFVDKETGVSSILHSSGADPYQFDTDPDSGSEQILYESGSRPNFDTEPGPGKNDTDPDPDKKLVSTRKILKLCVYLITVT